MIAVPRNKKLLIIDDEESFTGMLQINLEMNSAYDVVVENDPHKAIQITEQEKPDIIILDAIMPGLDGVEVLKQLEANENTRQIPVVFLTAVSNMVSIQPDEMGDRKVINKPVRLEELLTAVDETLA